MCHCLNCSEVLSLALDDANDAFGLVQSYLLTHQYSGAERSLSRPFPIPTDVPGAPDQARDRVLSMTQREDEGACTRRRKQEDDNINVLPKSKSQFLFQRSRHSSIVVLSPIDIGCSALTTMINIVAPTASSTSLQSFRRAYLLSSCLLFSKFEPIST